MTRLQDVIAEKAWSPLPIHDQERAERTLSSLRAGTANQPPVAGLQPLIEAAATVDFLSGVFGASPYLAELSTRYPAMLQRSLEMVPDEHLELLCRALRSESAAMPDRNSFMKTLRHFKAEAALAIALADIAGARHVMATTEALTVTGDTALGTAIDYLLSAAAATGTYFPADPSAPSRDSGLIVLGMGKYGASELNYSSDIDLIVFFERGQAKLKDGLDHQTFFVRILRDVVKLIQERTADGYVFRVDLRLRPDPGSTQIALSTDAALQYYESFGQNWERAALIKARPCAGDLVAGRSILAELAPYVWRKYLDFAAIADVHAMKRQIHAVRGFGEIGVAGHNIKLGRGGIREIEFFAQTQQIIAGGRQKDLRCRKTHDALNGLCARNWIRREAVDELLAAYEFLRTVEHRLQMVADEQTHELPEDEERLLGVARFCGFSDIASFAQVLTGHLRKVQTHYAALFENVPELTSKGKNLVFVGDEDDPATVATLSDMGFASPSSVISTLKGWHFGRYPATSTPRARERLTELHPALLEAFAGTAAPDHALAAFDRFLSKLPAGIQLFSLLRNRPALLRLLADIMGTAPRLAEVLARRRHLFDVVLDPGFFGTLPSNDELAEIVRTELSAASDYQEVLDRARMVGREQKFLTGVRVLSRTISGERAGRAYTRIADALISSLHNAVVAELAQAHGEIKDGAAVVVAMGKLGGRELTAESDLDLILVYDFDPQVKQSDGRRPLAPSQYFARLTQRLIAAMSAQTAEGSLYEVDMRLRPSGNAGPVATHIESFISYQQSEAWTWEHLALTRARVISGPEDLQARVRSAIKETLVRPRIRAKLAADVREMRGRIEEGKGTQDIWRIKEVRGGLIDLEFIVQFLQLTNAASHPDILDVNTIAAIDRLASARLLEAGDAEMLSRAVRTYHNLTQILRLCLGASFDPKAAPEGLLKLLAEAGEAPDFERLESSLRETLSSVHAAFDRLVR